MPILRGLCSQYGRRQFCMHFNWSGLLTANLSKLVSCRSFTDRPTRPKPTIALRKSPPGSSCSTAPPYEKSAAYSSYLPLYSFYKPCLAHRSLLKLVIIFSRGSLATWCGNGYFCPSPRSSEGMPQSFTELRYSFKALTFPQRLQVFAKVLPELYPTIPTQAYLYVSSRYTPALSALARFYASKCKLTTGQSRFYSHALINAPSFSSSYRRQHASIITYNDRG